MIEYSVKKDWQYTVAIVVVAAAMTVGAMQALGAERVVLGEYFTSLS